MNPLLRPTLGLLPILAVSAAVTAPAYAQETTVLDDIVVQGQTNSPATSVMVNESSSGKVLTPLSETPKTIKVITQKEIALRGQTSVTDILRTTPGITLGTGENGNATGVQPTIRGSSSNNNVTVDGFTSALRTDYEAFNVESIEINKGPSGSTSGTGAAGGAINLGSKTAKLGENFTNAGLTFGTGALKRATLDWNKSLDAALAVRLNVMAQEANSLNGHNGQASSRRGIAGSLTYALTDQTTVTAGLYYFRDNDLENYGVPFTSANTPAQFARGTGVAGDPFLPVDVPAGTFYGFTDRDFKDAQTRSGYVRVDHEFDNGLRWSTSLKAESTDRTVALTRPGSAGATGVTTSGVYHERSGKALSLNSQLEGDARVMNMPLAWAVGVDVSRSKITSGNGVNYAQPAGFNPTLDYLNPGTGVSWNGMYPTITPTDYEYNTRAIYGVGVLDLSDRVQMSMGLRFDEFRSESLSRAAGSTAQSNKSKFWNGNVGLTYKLNDQGMVYAAFSTSAEPVGESNGAGAAANTAQDSLDPERSRSIELGTKWMLFNERLAVNAAIFQTEKTNDRVTDSTGVVANIGETRSRGFELDVSGQINDRWTVSAGYTYLDAKVIDAGFSSCATACVPSASNGTRVSGVPQHALSLWTSYDVNDRLTVGGGAYYIGERQMGQTNATSRTALPSQWRVDLMAAYDLTADTAIQLNVNNVFDKQLYSGTRGNGFANVDTARTINLGLTHSF